MRFFSLYAAGLSAQDGLQPVKNIYNADSQDLEYSQALNRILQPQNEWGYDYRFKYLAQPSFSPECFLGLAQIGDVHDLIYRILEDSV